MVSYLFLLGLTLISSIVHAGEAGFPRLFFKYSFLYDGVCAGDTPVDPEWASEATSRESEFGRLWESGASDLLNALLDEFGKGFSRKEMTATLSVCPRAPSFSNPLVLNVTRFMKSYMKDEPVRPDSAFVDLTFHELLHTWVDENLTEPSPLLAKYKDEARTVRSHLHLMAVQKHLYLKLNREDLFAWISSRYPQMPGAYGRAWDIVDRVEGHEGFIAELKSPMPDAAHE